MDKFDPTVAFISELDSFMVQIQVPSRHFPPVYHGSKHVRITYMLTVDEMREVNSRMALALDEAERRTVLNG